MLDLYNSYIAMFTRFFGANVDWKQALLFGLMPIFISALVVEWLYMRKRKQDHSYTFSFISTNLNLSGAYQVFELLMHALFIIAAMDWIYEHRIWSVQLTVWTFLPVYILQEFCYYWFHRASHRVRWFWTAHNVHHTGEMMNLSTAARQGLLYSLTGYWLFFIPLLLIGMTPAQTLVLYGINLALQFFTHTEAVRKLPAWFEYVFNTPSHHRVHHGSNRDYMDKNFGGTTILFDRWFGTFREETEQVVYGTVPPLRSNNILTINFHEFFSMLKDMKQPGPLWQRLQHLWMPPEWVRPSARKPVQN